MKPTKPVDDCELEWQIAYEICRRRWRRDADFRHACAGSTLHKCASGLVSERCGGNPVSR
jgi:hypothetical protein